MTSGSGDESNSESQAHSTAQPAHPAPAGGIAQPYPYPYAYPPSATAHHNPNPYNAPAYGSTPAPRHNAFLCGFCFAVIAIVVLFGASVLILSIILRPRLPQFSVSSATLSSFNLSSQRLSSDFDVTLTIFNRNEKMAVHYDKVQAALLYKDYVISETSLPPFSQVVGNTTALRARLVTVAKYVEGDVVEGINEDRAHNGGTVEFEVGVLAWVRFTAWNWWKSESRVMRVYCDDVTIALASTAATNMVGPPKPCEVRL